MRDRPASFLVQLWLAAKQQRRGKAVSISHQQLAESVGIFQEFCAGGRRMARPVQACVIAKTGSTAVSSYALQRPWLRSQHPTTERGEPG